MNIKRAKQEIKDAIEAYLIKDEYGDYVIPTVRQRPVLLLGAPGIGKSTLMLQICAQLCSTGDVLYVSGEESEHQLKMRAERLHVCNSNLYVLSETNLSDILESVHENKPNVLIIDSIQTMFSDALDTPPGSIGQVKECTMTLMQLAKGEGVTVFVIGHVNKEGSIAGPKVLEHMVDGRRPVKS